MEEETVNTPRRLHAMTYKEKYAIIQEMDQVKSLAKVANEYGISKSTVHYIYKNKDSIISICEETPVRYLMLM